MGVKLDRFPNDITNLVHVCDRPREPIGLNGNQLDYSYENNSTNKGNVYIMCYGRYGDEMEHWRTLEECALGIKRNYNIYYLIDNLTYYVIYTLCSSDDAYKARKLFCRSITRSHRFLPAFYQTISYINIIF